MSTSGVASGLSATNGLLQETGLATGFNTNAIIQAELSMQELPLSNMEAEIAGLRTENNTLTAIQSQLVTVNLDAQALADPGLFAPVQAVTSSDSSLVTATSTSGVGAVIGSTVVQVTSLASAGQETFNFTSPTSADTLTFGNGQQLTMQSGASITDLVNAINSDGNADVWASVNSSGQVLLSTRATGSSANVSITDSGSMLKAVNKSAVSGQNAQYTINGTAGSSPTDTVTNAIPGVTLTLNGVTSSSNPVTITVQPPAPDTSSITKAVQQFITDYNAVVNSMNSTVNTQPPNGANFNPNSGSLFGDQELVSLMTNMRETVYAPGAGLPTGMAALSDIGITTGKASGSGYSQSSVAGDLTLDTNAFTQALQSNPSGVEAVLQQWSQSFQSIVNAEAGPGGSIDSRIQGDSQLASQLQDQYTSMQQLFAQQQKDMQAQWAQLEGTIANLKSQSTYLNSLSAAAYLNAPATTSSSSSTTG